MNVSEETYAKLIMILKALICVNFAAAIFYISFGCSAQFPIKSFSIVAMILLGTLAGVVGIIGLVGSHFRKILSCAFLPLHGLSIILQLVFVVRLNQHFQSFVSNLDPQNPASNWDKAHAEKVLTAAKVLLILVLLVEIFTLVATILVVWFLPADSVTYSRFQDGGGESAEQMISMQNLRSNIEKADQSSSSTGNKIYDKIRSKMVSKYGKYSHTPHWKRGWFGWS